MAYNLVQLRRDLDPASSRRPVLYIGDGKWGPGTWNFLYNGVLAFQGTREQMKAFFSSLGPLLPCPECRRHYSEYRVRAGVPETPYDAFVWLTKLEKMIAVKNRKKPPRRLKQIRKHSSTRKPMIPPPNVPPKTESKREDVISRLDDRGCPNCGKSRAELGVTTASMGLQGIGASRQFARPQLARRI